MTTEFAKRVQGIDRTRLTSLVRDVVQHEAATVVDWTTQPVPGGASQETGRIYGLYRLQGTARIQDKIVPWSLILKATGGALRGSPEPTHWQYWKREVLAYQSGLLEDLPGRIIAPRCYRVDEYPNDEFWIWLEDIAEESEATWTLERFKLTARYLGEFNGAYLVGHPLPSEPWLSKGRVRDWLARSEPVLRDFHRLRQHPLVQRWFTGDAVERTLQLWQARARLLEALDLLPRTLCHHDAFRRNFLIRQRTGGQEQTVAVDWAIVGTGAVGEEIAPLIGVTLQFLEVPMRQAAELDACVFEGYLTGLREAGWAGDERQVRFGFAATAALFLGVGAIGPVLAVLLRDDGEAIVETMFGCSLDYLVDQFALLQNYLLDLGEEAESLITFALK